MRRDKQGDLSHNFLTYLLRVSADSEGREAAREVLDVDVAVALAVEAQEEDLYAAVPDLGIVVYAPQDLVPGLVKGRSLRRVEPRGAPRDDRGGGDLAVAVAIAIAARACRRCPGRRCRRRPPLAQHGSEARAADDDRLVELIPRDLTLGRKRVRGVVRSGIIRKKTRMPTPKK